MTLTEEGNSIIIGVRQLLTRFDASMRRVSLSPSPVIPIRIGRYPERKDESIPWTTAGSAERDRWWDGMTHYRPFPILKNRARFFFVLCGM
jgi:hypothetical protein